VEPVTVTCAAACTVTLALDITTPFFALAAEDGAAIAGAVLAVWAVAYGIRVLVRVLRDSDGNNQPSED
jgi:hypothetical protein